MAAARALLTPARPAAIDETDESASALGVPPEMLAELKARAPLPPPPPPSCTVWPCNTPAVALFESLFTQWRVGPGGVVGLDYTVLPIVARSRGIAPRRLPQLLPDLQVMEDEALSLYAEVALQAMEQPPGRRPTLH